MILESISYVFHSISCPKYLKKLGLLQDLIAIDSRAKRLAKYWKEHYENSQDLIKKQFPNKGKKLVVFGAGLINDLPLDYLANNFDEVKLYDIFFLQETVNEIKVYPNVDFIEEDITGTLKELVYIVENYQGEDKVHAINDLKYRFLKDFQDFDADAVISLNLLSQLNLPAKKILDEDLSYSDLYASYIINHLDFLKSFKDNGRNLLLISDTEKYVCDLSEREKERDSSIEDIDPVNQGFKELKTWDWQLAPMGELHKDYSLGLTVKAFV